MRLDRSESRGLRPRRCREHQRERDACVHQCAFVAGRWGNTVMQTAIATSSAIEPV